MTNFENNDFDEMINVDTIKYLNDIYLRSDTYKRKKDEDFYRRLYTEPKNKIFNVLFRNRDLYEIISDKWKQERKNYKEKIEKLIDINDKKIEYQVKKIGLHLQENFSDIMDLIKHKKFIYKESNIKNRKELFERIYECVKYIFWVLQLTENELVDRSFFRYKVWSQNHQYSIDYNLFSSICGHDSIRKNYITRLNYFFHRINNKYKNDTFEVCNYTMRSLSYLFNKVIVDDYLNNDTEYGMSEDLEKNDYVRINNIIVSNESEYHQHYQKWVTQFGLHYSLTNLNARLMVQKYYIDRLKKWKIYTNKTIYINTPDYLTIENSGWCYYLNQNLLFINKYHNGFIQKIMNYNLEDYENN
jgi:hypothetical protein